MDWKETLLEQRARFILWMPVLAILLVAVMEFSPFYEMEMDEVNESADDGHETHTVTIYDDKLIESSSASDEWGNDSADFFDGEYQRVYEMRDDVGHPFFAMMEELDPAIESFATFSLILMFILVLGSKNRIEVNRFFNSNTIMGALLAYLAFSGYSLISAFGDEVDEFNEDLDEDDWAELETGLWGEATIEDEEGETMFSITWSPHSGYLLMYLFTLTCLLGASANFATLIENPEVEDAPAWFDSDEPPAFLNYTEKLPSALLAATLLLALASVFSPWYHIEQEWEGADIVDGERTNTTNHEFSWTLSPFMVIFDNESGLDTQEEGEQSTSYNSFSEHPELENIAKPMLELRWPLICLVAICILGATLRLSERMAGVVQGEQKGWSTLFLFAIVLTLSMATSSYEEAMYKEVEDDMDDLSPSLVWTPSIFAADDTIHGQYYTTVGDSSWWGDGTEFEVRIAWGESLAPVFASLAITIGMLAIAFTWAPQVIEHINAMQAPTFEMEQLEPWKGRPAIAMLVAVALLTTLGGGAGELIASSESAAPEGLNLYNLRWDHQENEVRDSQTMNDGQSVTLSFDTSELVEGNVTSVYIEVTCSEGDQDQIGDRIDNIDWSITVPEGVDIQGQQLSGNEQCDRGYGYAGFQADVWVPSGEIWAASPEEAAKRLVFNTTIEGTYELTITATVWGGQHPLESDDNLIAHHYFEVYAIDGIRAIVDE